MSEIDRIRSMVGAWDDEATVDAVERLIARAREWDRLRAKAEAWDAVIVAVREVARLNGQESP